MSLIYFFFLVDLEEEDSLHLEDSGYAVASQCPQKAAQEEDWDAII